jgi:hypothetical protein
MAVVWSLRLEFDEAYLGCAITFTDFLCDAAYVRLSKKLDYLVDNQAAVMLSQVKYKIKKKVARLRSRSQIGNLTDGAP